MPRNPARSPVVLTAALGGCRAGVNCACLGLVDVPPPPDLWLAWHRRYTRPPALARSFTVASFSYASGQHCPHHAANATAASPSSEPITPALWRAVCLSQSHPVHTCNHTAPPPPQTHLVLDHALVGERKRGLALGQAGAVDHLQAVMAATEHGVHVTCQRASTELVSANSSTPHHTRPPTFATRCSALPLRMYMRCACVWGRVLLSHDRDWAESRETPTHIAS
jgi:hypothetical protein